MSRSLFHRRSTRRDAPHGDSTARVVLAFVVTLCLLRVTQGLALEPRLGAETTLAMVGFVWGIYALMADQAHRV